VVWFWPRNPEERRRVMTTYMSAVPAYGRDYQTEDQVRADWDAGKDFRCMPGPGQRGGYIGKNDKPADMQLNIRYSNLTEVCVIEAES
jgi:hypothetical protein